MTSVVFIIGGIGFFLLGMNLITDGLKSIAGNTLRKWLNRFTGGTLSSIGTGTIITLLVQSSTATTLMTIGFVSAGMLSTVQAIGVIFGANLGTTSTGWIVSFIGLQFSISAFALPLVGIGMLLKQFSRGKVAHTGEVFTGFGLLFVGIQFLQDGMSDVSTTFDLSGYSTDSILSMIILVAIGIIMTIIMQSSSAAIATTITLLATDVIGLDQAVVLVIGQNIGTTATAAIAAIGASTSAKRTALSHILFNIGTGVIALLTLPLLMYQIEAIATVMGWNSHAIMLALFHTLFSLIGVLIFAPFIKQYARFIDWILPEKKSPITQYLDHNVIEVPSIAVETASRAIKKATILSLREITGKLAALTKNQSTVKFEDKLTLIANELTEIQTFLEKIQETSTESSPQYIGLLHALDHLERMNRLTINVSAAVDENFTTQSKQTYPVILDLIQLMNDCIEGLEDVKIDELVPVVENFSQKLASFRKEKREATFDVTAQGDFPVTDAFDHVQLVLYVDGLAFHLWRIIHHLHTED